AAIMAAGGAVPGARRFHDVLAASHVLWGGLLGITRHSSLLGGRRLDFGGAFPPREPAARHHRGRRRAADGRHFAERDAVARTVQYFPFGLRPRKSELDTRSVQISDRHAGVPPLASHLASRG